MDVGSCLLQQIVTLFVVLVLLIGARVVWEKNTVNWLVAEAKGMGEGFTVALEAPASGLQPPTDYSYMLVLEKSLFVTNNFHVRRKWTIWHKNRTSIALQDALHLSSTQAEKTKQLQRLVNVFRFQNSDASEHGNMVEKQRWTSEVPPLLFQRQDWKGLSNCKRH